MKRTFARQVYPSGFRFSIPKAVINELKLRSKTPFRIRIVDPKTGETILDEYLQMRSGPEVYGPEVRASHIKKGQKITVEGVESQMTRNAGCPVHARLCA